MDAILPSKMADAKPAVAGDMTNVIYSPRQLCNTAHVLARAREMGAQVLKRLAEKL